MSLADRAKRYLKARGGLAFTVQIFRYLGKVTFSRFYADPVFVRRCRLASELQHRFSGVVQAGPMKGVRPSAYSTWGRADRGPMLLGLYEASVMNQLQAFSAHASTLIDIGAADGYFGVGLVAAGVYRRSICFERDPVTRESLLSLARLNNVENQIEALGTADVNSIAELERAGVDLSDSVVLCDIEGGEFEIFSKELLGIFRKQE